MNTQNAPVRVDHKLLKRESSSPFRSECPVCNKGYLLVRREGICLLREDCCIRCGQRFIYENDMIYGVPLIESFVVQIMES